jgi:hypothetical protein
MFGFKNRKDQDTKKETSTAIGLGIMFGSIIGALTDNIGIWLPLGMAIGVGIGASRARLKK